MDIRYGEYLNRVEFSHYERYVFDYFLHYVANDCKHHVRVYDYLSDNADIVLSPSIVNSNYRVYELLEDKWRKPNKLLIIYAHTPSQLISNKMAIEKIAIKHSEYDNVLYLVSTVNEDNGYIMLEDGTYRRYRMKPVSSFTKTNIWQMKDTEESTCNCNIFNWFGYI